MRAGPSHAELRRLVAVRADRLCEYCLLHEDDTFFGCEVDHILSRKHGGPTEEANLAYACLLCNRRKGSDISTLSPSTGELVRLFNPRLDRWSDHFRYDDSGAFLPITHEAEATVRLLGLNHPDRLLERLALQAVGRYPTQAARARMGSPPDSLAQPR